MVPVAERGRALAKVAVVAVVQAPEIELEGYVRGRGEGAAGTAAAAGLGCLGALRGGGCSGAGCGAAVVLWLGICGAATVVGGVVGAVRGPSADSVNRREEVLLASLQARTVQERLRDQVVAVAAAHGSGVVALPPETVEALAGGRDYWSLAASGVETVLETALTKVGVRGPSLDGPLFAYMDVRVRLVRAADNEEILSTEYGYRSEWRTLAEWMANRGDRLTRALETGYEALGAHIHDQMFRLYPFPSSAVQWDGPITTFYGLAPIFPATRGGLSGNNLFGRSLDWVQVETLRPTFEWQGFPRESDLREAPAEMARVRDIRYELVVASECRFTPCEIIYRREGLEGTRHTIERPLRAGQRYFWTVRARFELDGRDWVTEWGSITPPGRDRLTVPSIHSYRFQTR
jgi:hypothetical protein